MEKEYIGIGILVTVMLITLLLSLLLISAMIIDSVISGGSDGKFPVVDTEEVPCIDERGQEFVDEICIKEITCSKLGIVGDRKC